jgi:hypothetical protein
VSQGLLPFEYKQESRKAGCTALAGLPLFLELACALGLWLSIRKNLNLCSDNQGWTDEQIVMSLVMLNLAGGDCVDDLRILENDDGFCRVFRMAEARHLKPAERAALEARFRRGRTRTLPCPTSVFRFLEGFADPKQEAKRRQGQAFIPPRTEPLSGLVRVNAEIVRALQLVNPQRVATCDMDATVVETSKRTALICYEGFRAYQPMNVYWAEQGVVLHTEFRDGNVPAGYEQRRVLEEALAQLPAGVEQVFLRSDTAGYQWDLLHYCGRGDSKRFGRIGFAVGCDVTEEFRKAVRAVPAKDWRPLMRKSDGVEEPTGREWAEVCYVPRGAALRRDDPDYRFIAVRELLSQQSLPTLEAQASLPFPTMDLDGPAGTQKYKLHGLVTNLHWEGGRIVRWLNGRCGKSEEVHSIQKEDLAGGMLPSGSFGENAAWWLMMVLAFNLSVILKRAVLGGEWANRRMKALRFRLLNLPGSFVMHANRTWLKVSADAETFETLVAARARIASMWHPPPG